MKNAIIAFAASLLVSVTATSSESVTNVGEGSSRGQFDQELNDFARTNDAEKVNRIRMYNPNSGEHFWTTSREEADLLVAEGWNDEGVTHSVWTRPDAALGTINIVRLYKTHTETTWATHAWLIGEAARFAPLLQTNEWVMENSNAFGAWVDKNDDNMPIYRVTNPNQGSRIHYTVNPAEANLLVSLGWVDEGVEFYVAPAI